MIEELSTDWDPERYEDCYRKRLERGRSSDKRKGQTIEAPEEPEAAAAGAAT